MLWQLVFGDITDRVVRFVLHALALTDLHVQVWEYFASKPTLLSLGGSEYGSLVLSRQTSLCTWCFDVCWYIFFVRVQTNRVLTMWMFHSSIDGNCTQVCRYTVLLVVVFLTSLLPQSALLPLCSIVKSWYRLILHTENNLCYCVCCTMCPWQLHDNCIGPTQFGYAVRGAQTDSSSALKYCQLTVLT